MENISKMKEGAWAWLLLGIVVTTLSIISDEVSVWLAVVVDVMATAIWAVVLIEEDEQTSENEELFNK